MRRVLPCLVIVLALAAAGCGDTGDSTPVACLEGDGVYLQALSAAPGAVKLRGKTPISACLAENQPGGDLATVGGAMIEAATKLNAATREDLGGQANLKLGYLLGAAQRGSEQTDGIHAELIRRLAVAARYSPDGRPLSATFLATYEEGFDAGEARG
jgi:hypothetical protein